MIIPPTRTSPATTNHGLPCACANTEHTQPSKPTSAKVRRPARALGFRSRSSPMSSPMARLVSRSGSRSNPSPVVQ